MADFQVGDRVRWGKHFPQFDYATVTATHEWAGKFSYDLRWPETTQTRGSANNIPEADLTLVARAVYMTPKQIAALQIAADYLGSRLFSIAVKEAEAHTLVLDTVLAEAKA